MSLDLRDFRGMGEMSAPELRQPVSPQDKIHRYEREKQRWIELHPEATSGEYQAAMTRLACEIGV